jgi:hypothetical protein
MTIDQYIANISKRFNFGNATEHTFRGDLQQLFESLVCKDRTLDFDGILHYPKIIFALLKTNPIMYEI